MRESIKEYIPEVLKVWWAAVFTVLDILGGIVLVVGNIKAPDWMWVAIFAIGFASLVITLFLPFHRMRLQREKLKYDLQAIRQELETYRKRNDPYFKAHIDNLIAFGQLLRDTLKIEQPESVWQHDGESGNLWCEYNASGLGGNIGLITGRKDMRTEELFPYFQQHLKANPCWNQLQKVEEANRVYREAVISAHNEVKKLVEGVLPSLNDPHTDAQKHLAFLHDAYYRATGGRGLDFTSEAATADDETGIITSKRLKLGGYVIGQESSPIWLSDLLNLAKFLQEDLPSSAELQAVVNAEKTALQTIKSFQEHLLPDDRLRKLVWDGRCGLCP